MSTAGQPSPGFEFSDEPSFEQSKAQLGLPDEQIDDHMWAIENTLLPDPTDRLASAPLASNPELRVAVSSSTPHSPEALRLIFRIDGFIIRRMHVERRGFTPNF